MPCTSALGSIPVLTKNLAASKQLLERSEDRVSWSHRQIFLPYCLHPQCKKTISSRSSWIRPEALQSEVELDFLLLAASTLPDSGFPVPTASEER